ncbi:MAG: 50S ribosomal protein L11 methyltransferase [Thermodesulfobacteriota bacterium]
MKKGSGKLSKSWLLLSLYVPRESVEAISNFLMEQGATGIEESEEGPKGERLKAYFPREGGEGRVLRALRRYLKSLQEILPETCHTKIEALTIPDQDWGENWKRFFRPFHVTSNVVVGPPWSRFRSKMKGISIVVNPGMAFGTGTHASTKLCIRALEKRINRKGLSVLDVGTGSGILSIVAARMGAEEVIGVDTDAKAVEVAGENVAQNQVSHTVKLRKGSIGSIRRPFDVIVANIDLRVLRRMKQPLLRHLKSKGLLILSGLLEAEAVRLRRDYMNTGLLQWVRSSREGEWVCLTFKKK